MATFLSTNRCTHDSEPLFNNQRFSHSLKFPCGVPTDPIFSFDFVDILVVFHPMHFIAPHSCFIHLINENPREINVIDGYFGLEILNKTIIYTRMCKFFEF